jgi:KaiC/GvpD/RAD55 family RecA-like ATPase
MMRKNNCTAVLASEIVPGKHAISRFGVEEFITDGIIILHKILVNGQYKNGLSIWKMKDTDHSKRIHEYEITRKGFTVYLNKFLKTNVM